MRREEKNTIIDSLAEKLKEYSHFYLTDTAQLNAADTSALRRKCFENNIRLIVVKNTLLKRALEMSEGNFEELYPVLKGTTSIMFSNTGNSPAKLIKEFRRQHDKPVLKGAYVQESVFIGDQMLDALVAVKTREELIGDIILLLQSPAKNVISALQSGGNKLHGVLETLSKKEN
ncbi:MAG: 50S ribosomal protein L10 [Bacteroidales bacterium]|jgi:large subunit ribosomal protein L10|nr:50S ribosomal protein L10 [Bacteroidales bacterium]MZP64980.1 50S ribosomal protein L10 [Bacteroidales bacterium]HPB13548.1 50S ribosomal protein L10 [Bacteroidales bacterium]HPX43275.1 50S ribosomal protein L10 [Bacteroidales bacterium]HQB86591.1 50S ribosomal protein L10 [Bacteroidales bacterium]